MEYQGFRGTVVFDEEAAVYHGEVINTRDVITFQGESVAELKSAFQKSVDDYLEFCAKRGEEPDKPFSGQFVARVSPELHRRASLAASRAGKSLNAWVAEQLQTAVGGSGTKAVASKNTASHGKRNSSAKARPKRPKVARKSAGK